MVVKVKDKFEMVGTKIKDFSLPNSRGETVDITQYSGNKNVVVILLRSIHWPYCKAHVARLAKNYEKFQQLDTEIYPILVAKERVAQKMETRLAKDKFPIYFDPDKEVVNMLNQENIMAKLGRMPAMLIIDKKGIIKYAHYGNSMSDIPRNTEILEIIEKLN